MARRTSKIWLLLAPLLALAAVIAIIFDVLNKPHSIADIGQTLRMSDVTEMTHLYPWRPKSERALLPVPPDRAVDIIDPDLHVPLQRFVQGLDSSSESDSLQTDGNHRETALSFYPTASQADVRRPRLSQTFAPGGDVVIAEKLWRLDGTLAHKMANSDDGRFADVSEYADDGYTVTFQKKTDLHPEDYWNGPRLLEERHYLDKDHGHALVFSSIYNPDGTSTITNFDSDGHVLREAIWSKWHSVAGTKVVAYYPGTHKIRFSSQSNSIEDAVAYYRLDGTQSHQLSISNGHTTVTTFDKNGVALPYEQYFDRIDKTVDGVVKSEYKLLFLTEKDAAGHMTRRVDLWHQPGLPDSEDRFNVTIGGVRYLEVDSLYAADGTLETVKYWKDELKDPPDKVETHLPAENIRMQLPDDETRLDLPSLDGDDLPVPPPLRGPGGH
ncbi:MAG: hypothetical protein P4L53_06495 [Candidatus Obscuribacterales bacterium]|nr:hypothetical protein [Candidatus Obscuribacterales bacterium]